MGASIIWAHFELFGDARISKAVFVDQAPLQVRPSVAHCRLPVAACRQLPPRPVDVSTSNAGCGMFASWSFMLRKKHHGVAS